MPAEGSTDDGLGRGHLLIAAGVGLVLLFGVIAATTGASPTDEVEVRQSILGGDRFGNLSETAMERLRPAFEGGSDPGTVNESEYRATFPGFPPLSEFDDGDRYFVAYEDRFYGVGLNESAPGAYSIEVTDETGTVRIEYAELSADARRIVERAASSDGSINVSELPPIYQADGLSGGPLGSQSLYYLSWDGTYYTVATYEPIEFVEGPTAGQVLGGVGVLVGILLALVGAGLTLRDY